MKLFSISLAIFAMLFLDATLIALGQEQEESPYVFEDHDFTTRFQTEHGRVRSLPLFTQRSELLRGIHNYLFAFLEAEPNTFMFPNHMDVEAIIFVAQGNGASTFVYEDRRESFELRRGDIFRVPAGIVHYYINKDQSRKLVLVVLLQPVANPGQTLVFYGPGGVQIDSFYTAFSREVLEAAFNTREEDFRRILGQKEGVIIRASEQQIKALTEQQGAGKPEATFNVFNKAPTRSNQFGQMYEVDYNEYQPLQQLDIAVSYINISRGGMAAPFFNSKAWQLAFVLSEDGNFEMVSPHFAGGTSSGPPGYRLASAALRRETLVVVPAGYPTVFVASDNHNLEIVSFEINAFGNEKFPLAGRGNVYDQFEEVAKELSFGIPAKEVDEVFGRQREQFFLRGPGQQQAEGFCAEERNEL